jgi:hypothetical protein
MTNNEEQKVRRILSVFFQGGENEVFAAITDDSDIAAFAKVLEKHDAEEMIYPGDASIYFTLPDGKPKYIPAASAGMINNLRRYDFSVIAQIFRPSEVEMLEEIERIKDKYRKDVIRLLSVTWIDISCGEVVKLDADFFHTFIQYKKSAAGILAILDKLPTETLKAIIEIFGEHSDFRARG